MNSEKYIEFSSYSGIYELLKNSPLFGKNSLKMLILVDMNSEKVCVVR